MSKSKKQSKSCQVTTPAVPQNPDKVLTIQNSCGNTCLEVYDRAHGVGIKRSEAFEEKGLATYAVNVGHLCGHNCAYCSTPSVSWRYRAGKLTGQQPFKLGYAVRDPNCLDQIAKDAKDIPMDERGEIQICTLTDAWSPEARDLNLGRQILETILNEPGWKGRLLTKNADVRLDFDVCEKHKGRVTLGLSLTATPAKQNIINVIEPNASTIQERMDAMKEAHKRGLSLFGMLCPLMPGISDDPKDILELVKFLKGLGVNQIWAEAMNRRGVVDRMETQLRNAGFKNEANAINAIRKDANWSAYVADLVANVQAAVQQEYGSLNPLKFLLYSSEMLPADVQRVQSNPGGVIWLKSTKERQTEKASVSSQKVPTKSQHKVVAAASATPSAGQASVTAPTPGESEDADEAVVVLEFPQPAPHATPKGAPAGTAQLNPVDNTVQQTAIQMLEGPGLVAEIRKDLATVGIIGESNLALLIYLIGTSRLLDKPLAAIVQGPSAGGKSYVINRVAEMFPPKEVMQAHRITPHALEYLEDGLEHKFVVGGERAQNQAPDSTRALRELLSQGSLSLLQGGKRREVSGPVAFVESTTVDDKEIFGEDLNRCVRPAIDSSTPQTERILQGLASRKAYAHDSAQRDRVIDKHRQAQSLLARCVVKIPFAEALAEAYDKTCVESRRTFELLLSLIEAVTLLHQRHRIASPKDGAVIVATTEDYRLARQLFPQRQPAVGRAAMEVHAKLIELGGDQTVKQLSEATEKDESDVRQYLNDLVAVNLARPGSGKRPKKFRAVSLDATDDAGKNLPIADTIGEYVSPHSSSWQVESYEPPKQGASGTDGKWGITLRGGAQIHLKNLLKQTVENVHNTAVPPATDSDLTHASA